MSFVSGLNRKLGSHSEVQAGVGCDDGNNTKGALALSTSTLPNANDL